jgi:hypothetical protein
MNARAKIVNKGGAQMVALPKKFRLRGNSVIVRRTAEGLLLSSETKRDPEKVRKLFAKLAGSCPDFPDVPKPSGKDVPRDFAW